MNIDEIDVRPLRGPELEAALDVVSVLLITVFRDWPYLYDGTRDYERQYWPPTATTPARFWSGPSMTAD